MTGYEVNGVFLVKHEFIALFLSIFFRRRRGVVDTAVVDRDESEQVRTGRKKNGCRFEDGQRPSIPSGDELHGPDFRS